MTREKGEGPVAATLQLVREGTIMELRRGRFQVLLDGDDVASIEPHQTIEVPIDPGHHELQVKAGRHTSRSGPFDTADGETVTFRCYGGRIWPLYLASILKPDLALTLKRE
jgi:hypothetical protein